MGERVRLHGPAVTLFSKFIGSPPFGFESLPNHPLFGVENGPQGVKLGCESIPFGCLLRESSVLFSQAVYDRN